MNNPGGGGDAEYDFEREGPPPPGPAPPLLQGRGGLAEGMESQAARANAYAQSVGQDVGDRFSEGVNYAQNQGQGVLSNLLSGAKDAVGSGGGDPNSYDFSNNVVTKFVFLIFVLLIYIFFLYLGLNLIGYILKNNNSPYIFKGIIPGNIQQIYKQNPAALSNAVQLNRSNNRATGVEFTWSFWLLVPSNTDYDSNLTSPNKLFQHVFNIGEAATMDKSKNVFIINGPGVYLRKNVFNDDNDIVLMVMMDTVKTLASSQTISSDPSQNSNNNILMIAKLPIMKWIHVAVRVEGTAMDAYINGVVAGRVIFDSVPNQNYYDVNCCCNNGFSGSLSNLQYFNYGLSTIEINSIVYAGPNVNQAGSLADTTSAGQPYYLNSSWFASKMQVN